MSDFPQQKKSSFWKIFTRLFLILLAVCIIFIGLLPSIASSTWGKSYLTKTINATIPGKIAIDRLSLSWFGTQKITGLKLFDPEEDLVLKLDNASVESSLMKLLFNPKDLNVVRLNNFNANLITDSFGNTNLMRALNKTSDLKGAIVAVPTVNAMIKNMNGVLELGRGQSPFKLQVQGETSQAHSSGRFNINAKLAGLESLKEFNPEKGLAEFFKEHLEADLSMNAEVVNFPVELLDQFFSLKDPKYAGVFLKTLGNELNIKVVQQTIGKTLSLNITASSPQLKATADVNIAEKITLTKPASINLKITPEAIKLLSSLIERFENWKLTSATSADILINSFQLPIQILSRPLNEVDLAIIQLKATADLGALELVLTEKQSRLVINGIHAALDANAGEPEAKLSLNGDAANNGQPMKLRLNMTLPKAKVLQNMSQLNLKKIFVEGQILGAPLFILNQESESMAILAQLLGPSADIAFSLNESEGKPLVSINYSSERFKLNDVALEISDRIVLKQPAMAVMKIPPALINQCFKGMTSRIQNPVTANLEVKTFNTPMSVPFSSIIENMASYFHQIDLSAELTVPAIKFIGVPNVGAANIANLGLHLNAAQRSKPEISLYASIVSDGPGRLYDVIGKEAHVKASGSLGGGLDGKLKLSVFNIDFLSDLIRAEISGHMVEGGRLILQNPVFVSYLLTPAGLNSLGFSVENFRISKPTPVQLTIDSSHIPLNINNLSALKLAGKIKLNNLAIQTRGSKEFKDSEFNLATLDNFTAEWNIDGTLNRLESSFSGTTLLGEQAAAGKLNGSVAIDGWHKKGLFNLSGADAAVKVMASNLPTQFLSSFSNYYDLVPILGNALNVDLQANIKSRQESKSTLDIEISSKNLQGTIALLVNDTLRLNGERPAEFQLNLTPEGYTALRQMVKGTGVSDFQLTDTAKATFKLDALNLGLDKPFMQAKIHATYSLDGLIGQDMKTKNFLAIKSIQGQIQSDNLSRHVKFDMKANGKISDSMPTSWAVVGALDNAFNDEGFLNKDSLSLQLDVFLETLPISLLCQFTFVDLASRNKLEAIIGPTLNASIKAHLQQMNGPLYIDLQGVNGHLNIDATLNNGYLSLNKQAIVQVAVTPQLSKYVLSEFIPIMSGMLSADHPIKLTLEKQGFLFSLKDPLLINASIGNATLDMGKVSFSNSSQLAKVLSLLTTASSDQFIVWLTPVYFSLNQGILNLQRVDMLISERYPIAAWGNVDFIREKVSMIIGLSGSAIQRAFSVSGLPPNYLLQIPLRGKLDSPSFDKTKAAARLSAIVAQTQGGPQGLVIGTVLDIASGGLTEGQPPAPTTNPLPWANLMTDQIPDQKEPNAQKIEKQLFTPLEEVKKGASSILKKIFK